jgi:Lipopolysaccharide kinase (Kdo/WaaP) family
MEKQSDNTDFFIPLTATISLGGGWTGDVLLAGPSSGSLSVEGWYDCLSDPELLLKDTTRTIKADGSTQIFVRTIQPGEKKLNVAVKSEFSKRGLRGFFRSLRTAKAKRNFKTAAELMRNNVPVVMPFAALEKRHRLHTLQSVYITSYVEGGTDMLTFVRENLGKIDFTDIKVKRQFCDQIGRILAALENNSLWHRDAKAGNFLVTPSNGQYKISLLDLDGIKPYRKNLPRWKLKCRTLGKLVSTLLWHPFINRTDYLRTLVIYSSLTGLDKSERKRLFRDTERFATAARLLTMVRSSIKKTKK